MQIRATVNHIAAQLHRQWWLMRLRLAERNQEKALANDVAFFRRLCGHAAGPHIKKVYARRVHVLDVIAEVVGPHKSREDLSVPEIQLVMFQYLIRCLNRRSQAEAQPA